MSAQTDSGARSRIIVVTGSPRSGTTAVGDAVAAAGGTMSLYEPLNRTVGDRRVGNYFEIPGSSEFPLELASELARDVANVRLQLRAGIFPEDPTWRRAMKTFTGSRTLASYRRARLSRADTLIWKDPFALFWLDFLERERPGLTSVVTYRPALAVAASFARLGWRFKVHGLVERLHEIGAFVHPAAEQFLRDHDVMGEPALNGAATWALVYGWYANTTFSSSALVDAKSFADDPNAYRSLYDHLGLQYTPAVERRIARLNDTKPASSSAPSFGRRAHTKHRNLSTMNSYFSSILSEGQQQAIREALAPVQEDVAGRILRFQGASTSL